MKKTGLNLNKRQETIIRLINTYHIETQEELVRKLLENGHTVTQATISRDIRKLELTKVSDGYGRQYYAVLQHNQKEHIEKLSRVLKEAFVRMDVAQNILVIHTVSGMAMAFAAALDHMQIDEIVGCVAGDDTVMCAIRSAEDALDVMQKVKEML